MNIATNTLVYAVCEHWADQNYLNLATYREPGYGGGLVIIGDLWCRCDHIEGLHSIDAHHPRIWARLEEEGVEAAFYDEWYVDDDGGAWRTRNDSYSWQSSILWCERAGDYLTPDDGIEAWIEEVQNDPQKALPGRVWSDDEIRAEGWREWECGYESGWHPGQDADPREITRQIRDELGDDVDVLFQVTGVGQWDVRFCAWVKLDDGDDGAAWSA